MKHLKSLLLGTTAILLAVGTMPAGAQTKSPGAETGAQSEAPGGSSSSQMKRGGDTQGGASGGAQSGAQRGSGSAGGSEGRALGQQGDSDRGSQGSAQKKQGDTEKSGMQDRAQKKQGDSESGTQGRAQKEDSERGTSGRAETEQRDTEGRSEGRALGEKEQRGGDRAGTDRGGDTSVQFTQEHKTKLTTYFKEHKVSVEPVREVNISVSVGTVVPQTIELHSLPQQIVVDLPDDREYLYFVYQDDIIVVDADTREIVYVVTNVV